MAKTQHERQQATTPMYHEVSRSTIPPTSSWIPSLQACSSSGCTQKSAQHFIPKQRWLCNFASHISKHIHIRTTIVFNQLEDMFGRGLTVRARRLSSTTTQTFKVPEDHKKLQLAASCSSTNRQPPLSVNRTNFLTKLSHKSSNKFRVQGACLWNWQRKMEPPPLRSHRCGGKQGKP